MSKVSELTARLLERVDPERLKANTLEFVGIPSPTGQEAIFSHGLARSLVRLNMATVVTAQRLRSPSVIAVYTFGDGPMLQFDGHTDTIDRPHDPPRFEDGRIYGRGACDMKGSLAAMVEAAAVLIESGVKLGGRIMISAHGLHEAPLGWNETLDEMIIDHHYGDAVVVGEVAHDTLPVEGNGMCIFEVRISRKGDVVHETIGVGTPNPLNAASDVLKHLRTRSMELEKCESTGVKPSLFVGQVQGGDFYNTIPTECKIVGTRRFNYVDDFADIRCEMEGLCRPSAVIPGLDVELKVTKVADGFRIDTEDRLTKSLERAYSTVTGRKLTHGATSTCGNLPWFAKDAGIPGVYHGPNQESAHCDVEYVSLDELVRTAKVYIALAVDYLGVQEDAIP